MTREETKSIMCRASWLGLTDMNCGTPLTPYNSLMIMNDVMTDTFQVKEAFRRLVDAMEGANSVYDEVGACGSISFQSKTV